MAVNAAEKTYLGAIKPIGEKIVLNFNKAAVSATTTWNFDFIIDQNYVLTDLSIIKTVADLPADGVVTVGVYKVTAGTDAAAVEVGIAQAEFGNSAVVGKKAIAGIVDSGTGAPTAIGGVNSTGTTTIHFNGTVNSTAADPVQRVLAVTSAAGTTSGKQRVRVKVAGVYTANPVNASCLIVAQFARFTEITQGTLAGTAGISVGELTTPPSV